MFNLACAWHHDGPFWNHQRFVVSGRVNGITHQIVDRSGTVENGPGAEHRALFHNRAFVHTTISPDHYVIFDNDRHGADRFDNSANLRSRGDVAALADLRATAN